MDTSDPQIFFDGDGVCNYCNGYIEQVKQRGAGPMGKDDLDALVTRIKKSGVGKDYDCVMGLSGGCDSSYLAFKVVELGLRPLTLHFDSGWNTETASQNIEKVVKKLNLDLYTIVCDWDEMRDLQRSFFKASLVNCDTPQDHAFVAALYQLCSRHGLKYWISGHDFLGSESILPKAWRGYDSRDWRHIKGVHKMMGGRPLRSFPHFSFWQRFFVYPLYFRIRSVNLFAHISYNKPAAKDFLMREIGWKDYTGKHNESVFTRFFQGYYLPKKFGYDKRRAHLSSLIVSGQMTRDQALDEMERPFYSDSEFLSELEYVQKKLGFSAQEWEAIMGLPPKDEHSYPNNKILFNLEQQFRIVGSKVKRRLFQRRSKR